jgi:hypothetical protein
MRKIALDLDTLSVQSFETTARPAHLRGTVRAAGGTNEECQSQGLSYCGSCWPTDCVEPSCGPPCEPTVGDSCGGSCMGPTCDLAGCSLNLTC